ncbi:MAG: hypothetical protein AAF656_03365 [Planctomycetota bacterium]
MSLAAPLMLADWVPFVTPLPIWSGWYWLLIPMTICVSIVWKTIKCATVQEIPKAAVLLSLWIIGGFVAAALALTVLTSVT